MKTSLWVLVVTLGCMGLAACAGDTAQPEPTLGITSPQVISQSQSPQSSDLSDYTEQEIWDMYDDGTIETVFPTSISNLQVDPRIYPDHIITKVSFDYFGSKRLGQARATLLKDGADLQAGTLRTKETGGFYFGIAPMGEFTMESFPIDITGNMTSCGLANKGYGKGTVGSSTTLSVLGVSIEWGSESLDHEATTSAPSDWCMEPEPPAGPPNGSSSGPIETPEGNCFWCETTYWLDEMGDVVHTETECEPISPSFCEQILT